MQNQGAYKRTRRGKRKRRGKKAQKHEQFIWKLPEIQNESIEYVIIGFIRDHSAATLHHAINSKTFNNIKRLCIDYISTNSINNLVNCCKYQRFSSRIFLINSLKWVLHIYPYNIRSDIDTLQWSGAKTIIAKYDVPHSIDPQQIYIGLHLVSLSPKISFIDAEYEISFLELNKTYQSQFKFSHKKCMDIKCSQVLIDEIKNLDDLTIKLNIVKLNGSNKFDNPINNNIFKKIQNSSLDHQVNQHTLEAFTQETNLGFSIYGDAIKMHSLKWTVEWNKILLASFNINHIFIYYQLFISDENGYIIADGYTYYPSFGYIEPVHFADHRDWEINFCEKFEINLAITLIDVFDDKGNNITKYFANHKPITLQPASYELNFPTFNTNKLDLLCVGYLRIICKIAKIQFMPLEIGKLFTLFYDNNNTLLEDAKLYSDLHNISYSVQDIDEYKSHKSKIFVLDSFKFYMEIFPAKQRWFVKNVSLSPFIDTYYLMCKLSIIVNGTLFISSGYRFTHFDRDSLDYNWYYYHCGWNKMGFNISELSKYDRITFKIDIVTINVFNKQNRTVTNYKQINNYKCMKTISNEYECKMYFKNEPHFQRFCSDIFELNSFKWCLEYCPNTQYNRNDLFYSAKLILKILSLPSNISSIFCLCRMECVEIEEWSIMRFKVQEKPAAFSKDETDCEYELGSSSNFKEFEHLTFKITITLIDVFEKDFKPITGQFINNIDIIQTKPKPKSKPIYNKYKFEYSIPCIANGQQMIDVVNGYINKLTCKSVDNSIYSLCIKYLNDSKHIINKIMNEPSSDVPVFCSNIFVIGFMKFKMIVYHNKTYMECILYPLYPSAQISKICVFYSITLVQTKSTYQAVHCLDDKHHFLFSTLGKIDKSIKDLNINQLLFKIEFNIINISDKNGKIIHINPLPIPCKDTFLDRKTWNIINPLTINKIKSAKCGECFESEIFVMHTLKWYIAFYPNGNEDENKGFCILKLIPIQHYCNDVYVCCTFLLKETNTIYKKQMGVLDHLSYISWGEKRLQFNAIKDLNTLTFVIDIEFLSVYDNNGKDITFDDKNANNIIQNYMYIKNEIWKITHLNTINKIKTAKLYDSFESNAFKTGKLYWKMVLFPNGNLADRFNDFTWILYLISSPPNIKTIFVKFVIKLEENNVKYMSGGPHLLNTETRELSVLLMEKPDIKKLNSLTFNLDLNVIDILDKNGNKIEIKSDIENNNYIEMKPISYKWKINKLNKLKEIKMATNGLRFCSDYYNILGFNFRLELYPNGKDKKMLGITEIFLCLKSLPIEINGASFYILLGFEELGIKQEIYGQFQNNKLSEEFVEPIERTHIKYLDSITIKLTMKLIHIYDINNNIITDKFITNNSLSK